MRRLITAALLALALGSAQAATQMEQLAKQMHPSEFPAQIEKLLNSGKAAQALELADLGIRKNERSPQLRFMRAVALENLTRSEEAVRELKQLIIDYPEIPEPYNNLAVIEAGLGNLEEAVMEGSKVVTPEVAVNYGNLIAVILDFIIIAFAVFCMVKAINKMHDKLSKPAEPESEKAPEPTKEEVLLAEIRDLLKEQSK